MKVFILVYFVLINGNSGPEPVLNVKPMFSQAACELEQESRLKSLAPAIDQGAVLYAAMKCVEAGKLL